MPEIREYRKAARCELGRRPLGCRRRLAGQCQYCARGFCEAHGECFGDGEEVCYRDACQAKKRDLAEHLRFRDAALERNRAGACGEPDCPHPLTRDCQRCRAQYCGAHLRQVLTTTIQGGEQASDVLRLCTHCIARAAIWQRA
jgi:hypothetical protein